MNDPHWIWLQPDWPHFSWQTETLCTVAVRLRSESGAFMGMLGVVGRDSKVQISLGALLQNIVTSFSHQG